jgi:hypothetical protein
MPKATTGARPAARTYIGGSFHEPAPWGQGRNWRETAPYRRVFASSRLLRVVPLGLSCSPVLSRLPICHRSCFPRASSRLPLYFSKSCSASMPEPFSSQDFEVAHSFKGDPALSNSRGAYGAIDCAGGSCFPSRSSASLRGKCCSLSIWTFQMERPSRRLPPESAWQARRSAGGWDI